MKNGDQLKEILSRETIFLAITLETSMKLPYLYLKLGH